MTLNARSVLSLLATFMKANPEIGFEKIGNSPHLEDTSVLWNPNREKYYHNYRTASFLDMGFRPPIIMSVDRVYGQEEFMVDRLDVRIDQILLYVHGSPKTAFRRIDLDSALNICFKKVQS
ncbi:MAG: hypothetical protein M1431_06115 [Candidatus Thermoplasmatota archaeon]|nr:hypothetical protein [Candidatus Thermoplasmatota archaeon]